MENTISRHGRPKRTFLTALAALLAVAFLIGAPAYAVDKPDTPPLTGADLQAMLRNGALFDFHIETLGVRGTTLLIGGGEAYLVWLTGAGQAGQDHGRWRIEGNKLCSKWDHMRGGQEVCTLRYQLGENRFAHGPTSSGKLSTVFAVRGFRPVVTAADHGKALAARYQPQHPDGPGPFPAALLVSGCSGFEPSPIAKAHYDGAQARLTAQGFLTLRVDYLGSRGLKSCLTLAPEQIEQDIARAIADLARNPLVKRDAINLIGWSWGGGSALRFLAGADGQGPAPVARVAAYYPSCGIADPWSSTVPVLVLHGSLDDVAPLSDCRSLFDRLPSSAQVDLQVLDNARHAFDTPGLPDKLPFMNGTIGSNPQAADKAWTLLTGFLQR